MLNSSFALDQRGGSGDLEGSVHHAGGDRAGLYTQDSQECLATASSVSSQPTREEGGVALGQRAGRGGPPPGAYGGGMV